MLQLRKFLVFLLVFGLLLPMFPAATAQCPEDSLFIEESYVNPLYVDFLTEADLTPVRMPRTAYAAEGPYVASISEAGQNLRQGLSQRQGSIQIFYQTEGYDGDPETIRTLLRQIAEEAIVHTGVPTEGDYLMWQFGGWNANASGSSADGIYYWTFTYTYTFYTTAEEESRMTEEVNRVLSELNLSGKSDYRKIKGIYDFICENVTYDRAHLDNPDYKRQFTAYAALMEGKAVCQGYSLLFYRLALELGVDCRLISGQSRNQGHGWNIASLDGLYYNLDSTWDTGEENYTYFLRSMDHFEGHTRDPEYATEEFFRQYPMGPSDYVPSPADACEHNYLSAVTPPGCLEGGYTTYTCPLCNDSYRDHLTEALSHNWDNGQVQDSTALVYTCQRCGATKTEYLSGTSDVCRIFGQNRYETAFKAAETLKEIRGIQKFDTILVASGNDFADALSGSYLAIRRNAPMLLVNPRMVDRVANYICENLSDNGTVYLLGGPVAVPEEMETALNGCQVIRLQGANRYETNLAILREAGMDDAEILVCTGKDFADSLSASALGKPILLVKNTLLDSQKEFLEAHADWNFYIIGGENAISMELADEMVAFGQGVRIAGANRYETSVNIASIFTPDCQQIVTAYGHNFPDGLCGGVLAAALNAPLILTQDRSAAFAAEFAAARDIRSGLVLGGSGLVSDETVRTIFSMDETETILLK